MLFTNTTFGPLSRGWLNIKYLPLLWFLFDVFFCFCLFFIFYRIHLFYQIAIAMHLPVLVISYSFIHIIEYSYLIHWLNKTEEEHNFLWAIFPIFIVIIAISKELCMVEFYSLFLKESEQILPFKCLIGFWCRLMFMYYTY